MSFYFKNIMTFNLNIYSYSSYRYIRLLTGVLEWQESQSEWYAIHNNNNYCHYSHNFASSESKQKLSVNIPYPKSIVKSVKCNVNEIQVTNTRKTNGKHKKFSPTINGVNGDINAKQTPNHVTELPKSDEIYDTPIFSNETSENLKKEKNVIVYSSKE